MALTTETSTSPVTVAAVEASTAVTPTPRRDGRLKDNLSPEQRSEIGRKGGAAVSSNREHMSAIGRRGGQKVSSNREHMASIGRKGGRA